MRLLFIGHVCVDQNVVRGQTETLYGGGVVHGAVTARRLGADAVVLTKCAESDCSHFQSLIEAGVNVVALPSSVSTSIRNLYPDENPDHRQSTLISRAAPFTPVDLEPIADLNAEMVHINPLWYGEFPPALLEQLRPRVGWLAADAQGFLRVPELDGRLGHRPLEHPERTLPLLDLLKVDAHEAQVLTGETDPRRAARAVQALGPKLVLLTHREGMCVDDGHVCHQAPFSLYTLEGRTGRGDTCTASFLVARGRGFDLAQATVFAAEITSRKMQYRGPFRG